MSLHALFDHHLLLLEQCRNLEADTPLREGTQLSDLNRNYHSIDLLRRSMIKDVEDDKAKAVQLSMTIFLLKSNGSPVKDRISVIWVLLV